LIQEKEDWGGGGKKRKDSNESKRKGVVKSPGAKKNRDTKNQGN